MFESTTFEPGDAPAHWLVDINQIDFETWGTVAEIASRPLGPWHMTGLLELDPSLLSPNDAVTYVQQWERAEAWVAGMKAAALADTFEALTESADVDERDPEPFVTAAMAAVAELAPALRIAPRTADRRVQQALDLAGPTEPLRAAMLRGELSGAHVTAISRELGSLPAAGNLALADDFAVQCAEVLSTLLPFATTHTPGECARKTRMLVAAVDPEAVRKRRRQVAENQHGVYLRPTEPGTCEITAIMPLAHGHAVMSAIDTLAKDERFETADGCVTLGQHRVAAMVALMLGDPGSVGRIDGPVAEAKITAHLNVVVPLATVAAVNAANGQGAMIGGEPVPADALAEMIVELAPSSTLRRLVVDEAGCIVDAGRTRYAISDTQRRLIELRDGTCRFPGCTEPAIRCDIDHATPYADGGCTDLCNLGPLCRRHHQHKTHGKWRITRSDRNGRCTWRSPLGRIYEHEPPDLLPPPPRTPVTVLADDGPPPF